MIDVATTVVASGVFLRVVIVEDAVTGVVGVMICAAPLFKVDVGVVEGYTPAASNAAFSTNIEAAG